MPARRAEIAVLARELVSTEAQGARGVLRFRPAARTRERVAAFVAAESRCCAFLRMELRDDARRADADDRGTRRLRAGRRGAGRRLRPR